METQLTSDNEKTKHIINNQTAASKLKMAADDEIGICVCMRGGGGSLWSICIFLSGIKWKFVRFSVSFN